MCMFRFFSTYKVHLHGVLITLVLMIASLVTAVFSRGFLGVSLTTSGVVHRCLGWVTAVLFVFLTIFGGFRGFQDPLRKITIFAHWFLGTLFYVLMGNVNICMVRVLQTIVWEAKEYSRGIF